MAEDPYLNYGLIYIRAGSFLIELLFAFPTFLWLLLFFIKKKSLQLKEQYESFSLFNYFMIAWIFLMWFLKLIHALALVFLVTLRRLKI